MIGSLYRRTKELRVSLIIFWANFKAIFGCLRLTHYNDICIYDKDQKSYFSLLCDQYGSDKSQIKTTGHPYTWPAHTYGDVIYDKFDHCREAIINVFECGIGTNNPELVSSMGGKGKPGASLRVWRTYFPNAQIVGADIDKSILFSEERISTYYVDQTNPNIIKEMWKKIGISNFDIMIDDGLHTFEAGVTLFENSIDQLSNDGHYFIEDVSISDIPKFVNYFNGKNFIVKYHMLSRPHIYINDNCLIVIRKQRHTL